MKNVGYIFFYIKFHNLQAKYDIYIDNIQQQ